MIIALYSEFEVIRTGGGVQSVVNTLARKLGETSDVVLLNITSRDIAEAGLLRNRRPKYDLLINHTPFQTSVLDIVRHRIMSRRMMCVVHSDPFYLLHHFDFHFSNHTGLRNYRLRRFQTYLKVALRYIFFGLVFSRIILLTERHAQMLASHNFVCDNKLYWISNPLGVPIKYDEDSTKDRKAILYLGRLAPLKRVDKLIDAWSIVSTDLPDYRFVIAGDGPELSRLKETVDRKCLINVLFLGYQTDVINIYDAASILLLCSEYEGTPQVIIEAQARGVIPIVCNTFSAATSLIDDGYNGFIVYDATPQFIAAKIVEVLARDDLHEIRQNCVKSCDRFCADRVADRWRSLIAENASEN